LGWWRFGPTGRRSYSGFWQQSDTYGGTLRFTISADGKRLTGSYEVDEHADHDAADHSVFALELVSRNASAVNRAEPRVEDPREVTVKPQYANPAYAEAEARMLAASKALQMYKQKGYSEKHPYTQRAQAELEAAQADLATLDKYLDRERSVINVST